MEDQEDLFFTFMENANENNAHHLRPEGRGQEHHLPVWRLFLCIPSWSSNENPIGGNLFEEIKEAYTLLQNV